MKRVYMDEGQMHHGYLVALFDILGFEHRLRKLGLGGMLSRYEALIGKVEGRNRRTDYYFKAFTEGPYWLDDGGVFVFNKVCGAYASDSILLWCNRTWPEARTLSAAQLTTLSDDKANGWIASPIPCDTFMEACNELMCHALEVGLPLRGALALGDGVFDMSRPLFLGLPLVEAARMEKGQTFIGASLCKSFMKQTIPSRFTLSHNSHLKPGAEEFWGGAVLDWPRHWRRTRSGDVRQTIAAMNVSSPHAHYYNNTTQLIDYSERFAGQFESRSDTDIRSQYPEFSAENQDLAVHMMVTKKIPVDEKDATANPTL